MSETTEQQRVEVRDKVLGGLELRDDVATLVTSPFARVLSDWSKERTWDVWARPELELKDRCLVTVAILAALGVERELGFHIRGALRNGATPDELVQVVMHVANYAGMPRASEAMLILVETIDAFNAAT
jgi:4-carboxymuconolactone decarboxylase